MDNLHAKKKILFQKAGYEPHPGQEKIHFPKQQWTFMVAVCGRRGGKTLAAAMEALSYLAQKDKRVWVVAPTYPLAEKVFREIWRLVVLDGVLGDPAKVLQSKRFNPGGGDMYLATTWGSWIEGKSADSPNSLVGEGLDFLIIDEAAKVNADIYEKYLEPTLLDRSGKCLMISTPEGYNWLHELWMRGDSEELRNAGWANVHWKSSDNPYLPTEFIENKKKEVTPEIYRQEYEASFEHHTGLVWPEFRNYAFAANRAKRGHIFSDDDIQIPEWWSHYRSIDIGVGNPTACIWAAVDKQGNVYVYDEYRLEETLADVHAQNIITKTRYPIVTSYIGHDADKTSYTDGKSALEIFVDNGIYCQVVRPDKFGSIQIVARYIRSTLEDNPKHPQLFVHERCVGLRTELTQYVWKEYKGTQLRNPPDQPRSYKDDLVDCLRNLLQIEPIHLNPRQYFDEDQLETKYPAPVDGRPSIGL